MTTAITATLDSLTLETQDKALQELASNALEQANFNIAAITDTLSAVKAYGNECYTKTFKEALVIAFCGAADHTYHANAQQRDTLLFLLGSQSFIYGVKYQDTALLDDYYDNLVELGQTQCAERFKYFGCGLGARY